MKMPRSKYIKNEENTDLFSVTRGNRIGMLVFLLLLLLLWAVPVYSLVKNSLKVHGAANYLYVLTNKINGVPFYRYFFNSLINAVCASALLVTVCTLAGFAFSKIDFSGRQLVFNMVVMCLAISGPILIIPLFHIYKTVH